MLAIARLIDGYNILNEKLPVDKVRIALIATIFHDTGYIQTIRDRKGTGAKYTLNHVERSIEFIQKYFRDRMFSKKEFELAKNIVNCTGLSTDMGKLKLKGSHDRLLGYMLGTADLIGQMASRTYLERLIYLYREFREGRVKGFTSELDLLKKTLSFYENTRFRIENDLGGVYKHALIHFKERYGIDEDLYGTAIARQIKYLGEILSDSCVNYTDKLRRKP